MLSNTFEYYETQVLTWSGLIEKTSKNLIDHDTLERRCSTLWFASLAYSQVLVTMDDTEFHSDNKRVLEVCIIVRTLRRLLYRLIWQDCDISNLPFVQQDILRHVTSRLFNQIHVRNSRRQFCDEENWLWPALPKTELVPAALESAGTFDYSDSMSYFLLTSCSHCALLYSSSRMLRSSC